MKNMTVQRLCVHLLVICGAFALVIATKKEEVPADKGLVSMDNKNSTHPKCFVPRKQNKHEKEFECTINGQKQKPGRSGVSDLALRWPCEVEVVLTGCESSSGPEKQCGILAQQFNKVGQDLKNVLSKFQLRILYKDKDPENKNWIATQYSPGCSSYIGKQRKPGPQILNLGEKCWYYHVVLHEFLHSMGLNHEHCRSDRDEFIAICHDNIKKETWDQFEKDSSTSYENFSIPYDFDSIMHYNNRIFAINSSLPTMVALKSENEGFGKSTNLSKNDKRLLRKMYPSCVG